VARTQSSPGESSPDIFAESILLTEFDPANLAHVVDGAVFEHRRLPGGRPDIRLLQCALPHSMINRGIYSPAVLVNGTFAPDTITFGMMLNQQQPTLLNGSSVRIGTLQFYAEKSEMCYRAWPNATWLAFVISRDRFLEFCTEQFDGTPALPNSGIATIEPKSAAGGLALVKCLRDLDRSMRSLGSLPMAARLGESVEKDLLLRIGALLGAKPPVKPVSDRRQLRLCGEILRDAMELVERDPEEVLDLQSMAKATSLGPRTLQRMFRAEYGLCPQEWMRVERLNRVREDLMKASDCDSVTETATRWGFFHLGRFSQYYRNLFGEKPSDTLARRSPA
jgi:AraC family transcriptional regulator, ethanolamine operon transcriptional activator